jgi:hypothetical protein
MEKLTENSENLKSDKVWHDGKLISKEEKRKKEAYSIFFIPFLLLFISMFMGSLFGEAVGIVLLVIFGLLIISQGFYYIFFAEKKSLLSGLYMLVSSTVFVSLFIAYLKN